MGQMQVDIFRSPMDTLKIFMHLKIGFECPFPHDHLLSETFRLQKENQAQSESKNFTYGTGVRGVSWTKQQQHADSKHQLWR